MVGRRLGVEYEECETVESEPNRLGVTRGTRDANRRWRDERSIRVRVWDIGRGGERSGGMRWGEGVVRDDRLIDESIGEEKKREEKGRKWICVSSLTKLGTETQPIWSQSTK